MSNEFKFKKGDKVTSVDNYELGVFEVLAYSSGGYCCYQKGFQGHSGNNSLGVKTFVGTEYEAQCYWFLESELAIAEVSKNYRNMKPTDLITISVDGIESEVPLGDIVHAVAILGVTNGYHGFRIWEALRKPFNLEGFVEDMDTVVEFRDKQKEALDYFFQPYYDKQQEKDELKTLIASKMEEVDALVKQLNQLNHMKESGVKIISGSTALVEYKKGSVIMCLPFGLNPEQCTRSDWDTVHHLKEEDFTNNSYIFKLEE